MDRLLARLLGLLLRMPRRGRLQHNARLLGLLGLGLLGRLRLHDLCGGEAGCASQAEGVRVGSSGRGKHIRGPAGLACPCRQLEWPLPWGRRLGTVPLGIRSSSSQRARRFLP